MFLEKYLSDKLFAYVCEEYTSSFLTTLEEKNFLEVYQLLKQFNIYFIEDLIKYDLELFCYPKENIAQELMKLKLELGSDLEKKIGNDLRYIDKILENLLMEE